MNLKTKSDNHQQNPWIIRYKGQLVERAKTKKSALQFAWSSEFPELVTVTYEPNLKYKTEITDAGMKLVEVRS